MPSKPLLEGKSSLQELLSWGIRELKPLGKAEARASAERFLEELTGFDRFHLYLNFRHTLAAAEAKRFYAWISQRKKRVPAAYLTGKAYFWREVLTVSPGCLIPRPETETLVEKFIEQSGFNAKDSFELMDIGSGSGAIGIALLRHYKNTRATLVDVSSKALIETRKNIKKYGLLNRTKIVHSDLFSAFRRNKKKWQVIVSNPPYLSKADFIKAQPEILKEPRQALYGGLSGLDFYRKIIAQASSYIKEGGWLVLEIGRGQAGKIEKLLRAQKVFERIHIFKDLNSIQRVMMARKKLKI